MLGAADEQLLRELTERAPAGGPKLTGQGGPLGQLTKMVLEAALDGEMDDHHGYGKHDPAGRGATGDHQVRVAGALPLATLKAALQSLNEESLDYRARRPVPSRSYLGRG